MNQTLYPAPLWRRFVAALIDGIIVLLFSFWITFVEFTVLDALQLSENIERVDRLAGIPILLFIAFYFIYYWGNTGATPAEKSLKLFVLKKTGERINPQDAFFRFFSLLIYGVGTAGIGFLWAVFHPEKLTLYDKSSKTIVVKKENRNNEKKQRE